MAQQTKNNELSMIYIPCPDSKSAAKIAKTLIERRLIACANIFPITSVCRWEGKISESGETVLIAKTSVKKAENAINAVKKIHPYKTPCVLSFSARANTEYLKWVEE